MSFPTPHRLFGWFFALAIASSSIIGFHCQRRITDKPDKPGEAQTPPPNQINLTLTGNVSDTDIKTRLSASSVPALFPPDSVIVRRCKCDENLINIAIPSSFTIILKGADGPLAVKNDGGQSGDIDLPFSGSGKNFALRTRLREDPPTKLDQSVTKQIDLNGQDPTKTITIAVFDTGLLPYLLTGTSWPQSTSQCATPGSPAQTSLDGWNFTSDGPETTTTDNSPMQHGSRVANLIQRQFNGGTITPKIVPMKVLSGSDNEGDLFALMCAMETARKNNIRIFNMSLGYYGDEDTLLKAYVKRAIDSNVLIVAAAGNQPDATVGRNFSTMTPKFYPAQFSKEFTQVIAVTTAERRGTSPNDTLVGCPTQNYGPTQVFGVLQQASCRFVFEPTGSPTRLIGGSSYATPILAGWLARKMAESPAQSFNQTNLPPLLSETKHGNQLYKNRYLTSVPPLY